MADVVFAIAEGHEADFRFASVRAFLDQFSDVQVISSAVPYMATARLSADRLRKIVDDMEGVLEVFPSRGVDLLKS